MRVLVTNDNKLTIENTILARLTASSITINDDGEIENRGFLEAKNPINGNAITVRGILTNFSQVTHEASLIVTGIGQLLNKKIQYRPSQLMGKFGLIAQTDHPTR